MPPKNKLQNLFVYITNSVMVALSIGLITLLTYCFPAIGLPRLSGGDTALLAAIYLIVILLDFGFFAGNRDIVQKGIFRITGERLTVALFMLLAYSLLTVLIKSPLGEHRRLLAICCLSYLVFTELGLLLLRPLLRRMYKTRLSVLTGVLTVSDRAERIVGDLKKHWNRKIVGLALLDDRNAPALVGAATAEAGSEDTKVFTSVKGIPVKANYASFMDWIRSESLDELYVDIPYEDGNELRPFLEEIQSMGTVIHLNATILSNLTEDGVLHLNKEFSVLGGRPMMTFSLVKHNPWALMVKRIADILIGLVGSILSAPIILITAIPLLIESPGPLIFKQKRMGKNGRVFNVYKLRSMYRDAEERKAALMAQNEMNGLMFKMKDDPRITKVGKFIRKTSIDELPQFWNILKGDMSFVGTRPPTLKEYEQYSSHHKRRLSMKPGLTGMWQVSGRSTITDFEEVVKLDVSYIDNWSLLLDLKIMLRTVWVVLARKGSE